MLRYGAGFRLLRGGSPRFPWLKTGKNMFRACILLLAVCGLFLAPLFAADSGIETGVGDDFTVKGVEGTALDPDVEIKGFSVFGATQAAYAGAVIGPGNMVVNGVLGVSSGIYSVSASTFAARFYAAGVSSFSGVGNIFISDGGNNEVLAKDGTDGSLKWSAISASGDDLGDHVATTTLNMATKDIVGAGRVWAGSMTVTGHITASSATISNLIGVSTITVSTITVLSGPGVVFSTHILVMDGSVGIGRAVPQAALDVLSTGAAAGQMAQIWRNSSAVIQASMSATGVMMAKNFVGDGSGLTGLPGGASIPSGMVSFFALTSCPSGWSELTAAQGRYMVGRTATGSTGTVIGTALTNTENRAVGQHNHSITDPGHSHSGGVYAWAMLEYGSTIDILLQTNTGASVTGISINNSGSVAGTPAPYIQLLVCKKD